MKKNMYSGAFLLGALAILWIGIGFIGTNLLALVMTVAIALVYGVGALELHRFRQSGDQLAQALQAIPEPLDRLNDWLHTLPPDLQNPVRLRIEGERIGLPGPALTPYLVGLLVMLGMLGTFLGMVVTLNGAAFSLEGSADLQAIRTALASPIKGLGLAFGTSVAGVAASAMLGLMSALCRRERAAILPLLDHAIAHRLRAFSLAHQRQESYRALQSQADALPRVVDQLQAMMTRLEQMNQQTQDLLTRQQRDFHDSTRTEYEKLAEAVGLSLKDSLARSAQLAGESIRPVMESALAGISSHSRELHEQLIERSGRQLDEFASRFAAATAAVTDTWHAGLDAQNQRQSAFISAQAENDQQRLTAWNERLEEIAGSLQREWHHTGEQAEARMNQSMASIRQLLAGIEDLVRVRVETEQHWTQQHGERMEQLSRVVRSEFATLRDDETARGQAAAEQLESLHSRLSSQLTTHLSTLGTALEAPIARLIATASEAPRAAAELIGQLRQEISNSMARDNELLEERGRILDTLNTLLASIHHASGEQREVIDTLVASSADALNEAGRRFAEQIAGQTTTLDSISGEISRSALEVSRLGETFGAAIQSFNDANANLIANLQRIEAAMEKSTTRSDEQLAYYVAQAREVIDLSILSQKSIMDELRRVPAAATRIVGVAG